MSGRDIFQKNFLPLWRDFLNNWYHHLTRVIRPRFFYSYLRAKGIFTVDDEELVENTYVTTAMKAGCLIDTVTTKGEKGFIAFMEVIEYSYPDLFRTLTNLIPRRPPESYQVTARASVTDHLLECLSSLQESLREKRENLEHMQNTIRNMKAEFDQEVRSQSDEIEILTRDNNKLRKELESLEEMRKVYKQTSVEISVERLKNQKMRDTWERMTSKELQDLKTAGTGIALEKLNAMEVELEKWKDDRKNLESTIEMLEKDRDKHKLLYEELLRKYKDEQKTNKKLETECHQYLEKYNEVVDIMGKLEREIMEQNFPSNQYSKKMRNLNPSGKGNSIRSPGRRYATVFPAFPPLLVYPPQCIKNEVIKFIAKQFGRIPADTVTSSDELVELLKAMEVLDYEKTDSGYLCIRNSQLRQMEKTALLEIPVTFVAHLARANIKPVIVVIKFINEKPSEDEEYLKREGFDYHTIEVDRKFKANTMKLEESVLPKVKSLVN